MMNFQKRIAILKERRIELQEVRAWAHGRGCYTHILSFPLLPIIPLMPSTSSHILSSVSCPFLLLLTMSMIRVLSSHPLSPQRPSPLPLLSFTTSLLYHPFSVSPSPPNCRYSRCMARCWHGPISTYYDRSIPCRQATLASPLPPPLIHATSTSIIASLPSLPLIACQ